MSDAVDAECVCGHLRSQHTASGCKGTVGVLRAHPCLCLSFRPRVKTAGEQWAGEVLKLAAELTAARMP